MLKVDLHMHSSEDPVDTGFKHDARMLINRAAARGFHAIAITNHDQVVYTPMLALHAASQGVLLIAGCEATIQGKHVLIYNISEQERASLKTFNDLAALRHKRGDSMLVIAPHSLFPNATSIGRSLLIKHAALFDAIELNQYGSGFVPWNKRAAALARKLRKPLVANSDAHSFRFFGNIHTFIDSPPTVASIMDAIRVGHTRPSIRPMKFFDFVYVASHIIHGRLRAFFGQRDNLAF